MTHLRDPRSYIDLPRGPLRSRPALSHAAARPPLRPSATRRPSSRAPPSWPSSTRPTTSRSSTPRTLCSRWRAAPPTRPRRRSRCACSTAFSTARPTPPRPLSTWWTPSSQQSGLRGPAPPLPKPRRHGQPRGVPPFCLSRPVPTWPQGGRQGQLCDVVAVCPPARRKGRRHLPDVPSLRVRVTQGS